jgi:hypothetical protein
MIGRTFFVLLLASFFAAAGAQAQTFSSLHSFCGQSGCSDGALPQTGLVADATGNLYGITYEGGVQDHGIVYELSPNGSGGWIYSLVHTFCVESPCSDGWQPSGPLIVDSAGDIYGVVMNSNNEHGLAYELMPQGGGAWNFVVMHNFCKKTDCIDGNIPSGGLAYLGQRSGALYDGTSPLYGTTLAGGLYGSGAVYQLTPPPPGGHSWWRPKVLYSFCHDGGNCLADGFEPLNGVVVDSHSVLYGTTSFGGQNLSGNVFKLTHLPHGGDWSNQVLYNFCSLGHCADGKSPTALVEDDAGNLIGGTDAGPHRQGCVHKACGAIFSLSPETGVLTTLHTFCGEANCADGGGPGPVHILPNGDLIGTAGRGGDFSNTANGGGLIFRLSGTTYTVLHEFCASAGCTDGSIPGGQITVDAQGRFFGITALGGTANEGTIYEFTP